MVSAKQKWVPVCSHSNTKAGPTPSVLTMSQPIASTGVLPGWMARGMLWTIPGLTVKMAVSKVRVGEGC